MIIAANKPYTSHYKTVSRWIKVYYTLKDCKPYFRHNGRRYYLDDFMRLSYPIMWEDKEGKLQHISGYYATTFNNPYLIEIDDCGEYIRLWEEIEDYGA